MVFDIIKANKQIDCAGMFDFYKKIGYDYKKQLFVEGKYINEKIIRKVIP